MLAVPVVFWFSVGNVQFARLPELGVPNAPPLVTKAPADPTLTPSAVVTPVPGVVVARLVRPRFVLAVAAFVRLARLSDLVSADDSVEAALDALVAAAEALLDALVALVAAAEALLEALVALVDAADALFDALVALVDAEEALEAALLALVAAAEALLDAEVALVDAEDA